MSIIEENLSTTDIPDISLEELEQTHKPITFDLLGPDEEGCKWLEQQSIKKKVYFVVGDVVLKVYISNQRSTKMYIDFSNADFAMYCHYPSRSGIAEFPIYKGYRRVMLGYSLVKQLGNFYIPNYKEQKN